MPAMFKHFIRMGSYVEKNAIEQSKDCFDGIFINANLLESTASATTSFITTILSDKDYVIDPIPFAFSLHQDHLCSEKINRKTKEKEIGIKNSFRKLSKQYGPMIEAIAGKRRLALDDFSKKNINVLAKCITEYQLNRLSEEIKDDSKYGVITVKKPAFIMSPYFSIQSNNVDEWTKVNQSLIIESKIVAKQSGIPLYGVILLGPVFLDDETSLLKLAKKFLEADADGYLYWIDDLDEQEITTARLNAMKKFIEEFKSNNKQIINMYGGYLSVLLSKYGLSGIVHGVAYWEKKQSKPISGGAAPPAKFYMNPIHERVNPDELSLVIDECKFSSKKEFLDNICNCDICNKVITDKVRESFVFSYGETELKAKEGVLKRQPTENSRLLCRSHYLRAKNQEIKYVLSTSQANLKTQLNNAKSIFEDKLDSLNLDYLGTWASML